MAGLGKKRDFTVARQGHGAALAGCAKRPMTIIEIDRVATGSDLDVTVHWLVAAIDEVGIVDPRQGHMAAAEEINLLGGAPPDDGGVIG